MVPEWFYADQGQQRGPVTFADLQALAAEGRLRPSDLVWKNGWPDWLAAGTQESLFAPPVAAARRHPAPVVPELAQPEEAGTHEDLYVPPVAAARRRPAPVVLEPAQPEEADTHEDYFAPPVAAVPQRPAPVVLEPARPEQLAYDRPISRGSQRASTGSGFGALALIGAAGLLVVCVGCGVLAAFINAGASSLKAAAKPSPERTWNLPVGRHQAWILPFNKDDDVTIKVKSDFDSDVDLFVFSDEAKMNALMFSGNVERNVGFCVAFDNSPSKDCYVRFVAPQTGNYYVVVANRNSLDQPRRNRANSGKLTFYPAR
jgi:hypothetical protein